MLDKLKLINQTKPSKNSITNQLLECRKCNAALGQEDKTVAIKMFRFAWILSIFYTCFQINIYSNI